jgi:hypothetical protein
VSYLVFRTRESAKQNKGKERKEMKYVHLMIATLILAMTNNLAHADVISDTKFIIDGNFGLQNFNQGIGGKFAYGLGFDARIAPNVQVGLEYRRAKLSEIDGIEYTTNSYLVNGLYRMPAGPGNFAVGLELGETEIDQSADLGIVSATLATESEFVMGPKAAYQISLGEHWEVSANVDYLVMFSTPKFNALGAMASISYGL